MSEPRRPLAERLTLSLVTRPYGDPQGRKGWLSPLAHAQLHVVRRYRLALPEWPAFDPPLRIAFLSDFHIGSHTGDVARFTALADEVAAAEPDLVLLGGDYMNIQAFGGGRVPPQTAAALLACIRQGRDGFAILGNHDYLYGEAEVAAALRDAGIAVLDHTTGTFSFRGHEIAIVGVPDAHVVRPRAQALVASLRPGRPTIVLAHDPVWFADVPAGPFLTLSGHTHGGQIRLPFVGIVTNASRAPLAWSNGLVVEDGRHMIVSAGLGTSTIPLRVGVPPDYALIDVSGA